ARMRSYIRRHCEPPVRRKAPPDDRLREAIHPSPSRVVDCFASLAMTWRETAYRCKFGSIKSLDLYKPKPILPRRKRLGGRNGDRRCQGVRACHALGAQF